MKGIFLCSNVLKGKIQIDYFRATLNVFVRVLLAVF